MDKLSKSDRKAALSAWKAQERAKAQEMFPLPDGMLRRFFASLEDRLEFSACQHDTAHAKVVAREMDLTGEELGQLLKWCEANGGFCDCEIILNTMGHWDENRGAVS